MKQPKWMICPTCQGEGKSSAHMGAFSAEEFEQTFSPEEQEQYRAGGYDRPCERCEGSGKVTGESETARDERLEELRELWRESGCPEGSFSRWAGV